MSTYRDIPVRITIVEDETTDVPHLLESIDGEIGELKIKGLSLHAQPRLEAASNQANDIDSDHIEGSLRQILAMLRAFPGTGDLVNLMNAGNVDRLQNGELDAESFFRGLVMDLNDVLKATLRVAADGRKHEEAHSALRSDVAAFRRVLGTEGSIVVTQ